MTGFAMDALFLSGYRPELRLEFRRQDPAHCHRVFFFFNNGGMTTDFST
jgi:hypothetical protein